MNKPASLAELDKLQSIHPFTNLRRHEQKGPVLITRGASALELMQTMTRSGISAGSRPSRTR